MRGVHDAIRANEIERFLVEERDNAAQLSGGGATAPMQNIRKGSISLAKQQEPARIERAQMGPRVRDIARSLVSMARRLTGNEEGCKED